MSGFGYNVQKVENQNAFAAHFKKAKLAGSLFFAGSTPFEFMVRLANENPEALIVVRNWPDTDQHKQMTPQQWMDRFAFQSFSKRLIIGASNECDWNPQFLAWTLELCKLAVRNDVRICIINLNSGHNTPVEWAQAREILQLACNNPDLIYIGLHEYAGGLITSGFVGGDPTGIYDGRRIHSDFTKVAFWPEAEQLQTMTRFHCGRFKFLEDYCKQEFGKVPSVILTEHGFDYLSDIGAWLNALPRSTSSVNGWRTLKVYWSQVFPTMSAEEALWFQLRYADETIYQGSCVKAQFIFDYGINPDWEPYRVDGVLETPLEEYAMSATQVDENKIYTFTIPGGSNLNIRSLASTSGLIVGKLPNSSIAVLLTRYLQLNNNWCKIDFNGLIGYVSLLTNTSNVDTVTLTPVIVTPVPPPPEPVPPPTPTPTPETNWTAVKADIDTAIAKLQSIKLLLP